MERFHPHRAARNLVKGAFIYDVHTGGGTGKAGEVRESSSSKGGCVKMRTCGGGKNKREMSYIDLWRSVVLIVLTHGIYIYLSAHGLCFL